MKKFIISTIIFTIVLLCFYTFSFAANDILKNAKDTTNSIGNAIGDTSNNAKNVIGNAENTVEDGFKSAGNSIKGATGNVENTMENSSNGVMAGLNNNDNYNTTRTATSGNFLGMSSTGWTWLILAVVGIVIVGLVWYYGAQYEHTNYSDGE